MPPSISDPAGDDWSELEREACAVFALSTIQPPDAEGHFAAKLTAEEVSLLDRFASSSGVTEKDRQAAILLLRQNRRALEHLASIAIGRSIVSAQG